MAWWDRWVEDRKYRTEKKSSNIRKHDRECFILWSNNVMLYWEICDEQYEKTPESELEELDAADHSLDRECIRSCRNCLEQNFCSKKFEDKCIWCNFRYTDQSQCENC